MKRVATAGPRPGGRRRAAAVLVPASALVLFLVAQAAPGSVSSTSPAQGRSSGAREKAARTWLGPDGEVLPFRYDAEVMEFLRTAPVVGQETIDSGINRPLKVLLSKNGIQAHAVFRDTDRREERVHVGGRFFLFFSDSYLYECAAFELSRLLGLGNVPPAVLRRIRGRKGSLQIWVQDTGDETSESFDPPDRAGWLHQVWDMQLFDNLIFNTDRNQGNVIVDGDYTLWMIDHTRAFQIKPTLLEPERLTRVNRRFMKRLRALNDETLRDTLKPYLNLRELEAQIDRRDALFRHVSRLVADLGEEAVYY